LVRAFRNVRNAGHTNKAALVAESSRSDRGGDRQVSGFGASIARKCRTGWRR